jgi:hypothetical protein
MYCDIYAVFGDAMLMRRVPVMRDAMLMLIRCLLLILDMLLMQTLVCLAMLVYLFDARYTMRVPMRDARSGCLSGSLDAYIYLMLIAVLS